MDFNIETVMAGISVVIIAVTGLIGLAEFVASLTKSKEDDAIVKKVSEAFKAMVGKLQVLSLYKPKV